LEFVGQNPSGFDIATSYAKQVSLLQILLFPMSKIRFDFTFGKLYIKITKVYVWLRFYTLLGAILLSWEKASRKEKRQTRVYGIF